MTDYQLVGAIEKVARALRDIGDVLSRKQFARDPIFIMVPSDLSPEDVKKMATMFRDALHESSR